MTVQIDARGLICPLPVLRLRKRLMALPQGSRVALLATDPAAVIDVPHFCAEAGHRLIARRDIAPGETEYIVERGPACAIAAD
ncbi:sulfurtransferase TusA family protein [Paracoccus thiocyanatus]|uniref:Sulfurtransferase TusA family protein n=1 Tax=Paracoccus thiocyanatus TaxID=34006 RepID=A0A3D8PAP8_9RHOB|nr:sulfurtransferase TusA family protein [Paracoccus thiocyanatus]RDW13144.1 sulfurtransferase TusA family protein [Paracoccus thiocyanatus]